MLIWLLEWSEEERNKILTGFSHCEMVGGAETLINSNHISQRDEESIN
jgi:hypothetical protein